MFIWTHRFPSPGQTNHRRTRSLCWPSSAAAPPTTTAQRLRPRNWTFQNRTFCWLHSYRWGSSLECREWWVWTPVRVRKTSSRPKRGLLSIVLLTLKQMHISIHVPFFCNCLKKLEVAFMNYKHYSSLLVFKFKHFLKNQRNKWRQEFNKAVSFPESCLLATNSHRSVAFGAADLILLNWRRVWWHSRAFFPYENQMVPQCLESSRSLLLNTFRKAPFSFCCHCESLYGSPWTDARKGWWYFLMLIAMIFLTTKKRR